MAKVKLKNEVAKLRNKNLFFLFGFFFFAGGAYILLPYYFAAGLLCIFAAGVCVWLLISPTIHYLPSTRHAVVSLDISGASKSIRFVRTNVGSYVVCIYTPQTTRDTVVQSVNEQLTKVDGVLKSSSDYQNVDRYINNGNYKKNILADFEYNLAAAIVVYLCLVVRSNNATIFNPNELKQYLSYLSPRIFLASFFVRFLLIFANGLFFSFLISQKASSSPTLSESGKQTEQADKTANLVQNQAKNAQIEKEASYE